MFSRNATGALVAVGCTGALLVMWNAHAGAAGQTAASKPARTAADSQLVLSDADMGLLPLERIPLDTPPPDDGRSVAAIGADVAVCMMINTWSWGRVGDIHGFSIRTDSWNAGDELLQWQQNTNWHPVIAQNMYKYRNGRLEQIGQSWLKHGFCALQQTGCGSCPGGGGCPQWLQPGCRDPYDANLNGSQTRLGPRSEVNPSDGLFPYPYQLAWQQTGNAIYKRLQVHDNDLNPSLNAGAIYYIEGQYVHRQEGTSDRRHNNASYERITPTPSGNTYLLGNGTATVQMKPAIYAWQDNDPEVIVKAYDVPGNPVDGRFHIAYRVFDNGDGTWRYEYAVRNMNSHRAAQGFTVPIGSGATIIDTYHRDIKYHSGEVYTNENWTTNIAPSSVSWSGQSFNVNPNANALRWGTMFNFSITTNAPPVDGAVTLNLFRPGDVPSLQLLALVPGSVQVACPADLNGDGEVDVLDMLALFAAWGPNPGHAADLNGDNEVDVLDMLMLFAAWGACP